MGGVRGRLAGAAVVLAWRLEHLLERVLGLHPRATLRLLSRKAASAFFSRLVGFCGSDEPGLVSLVRHLASPLPVVLIAAVTLVALRVSPGLVAGLILPRRFVRYHLAGCIQPDGLLHGRVSRRVLVRDDHEFCHGSWLRPHELVLEHGAVSASVGEELDSLHFVHSLAGVAQAGPPHEVFAIRLLLLLDAQGQLARATRALVCAGEVPDEDFLELQPGVDAGFWEVV